LLIITLGADAVGGVLSTVVVPVTVDVTVFSAYTLVGNRKSKVNKTIAMLHKFLMPSLPSHFLVELCPIYIIIMLVFMYIG